MQLANALRVDATLKHRPEVAQALCEFIFALLVRPFPKSKRGLIKPTNSANNLIGPVRKSGVPALVLYGDLRSFLGYEIKKGETCKSFMRLQYNIFRSIQAVLRTFHIVRRCASQICRSHPWSGDTRWRNLPATSMRTQLSLRWISNTCWRTRFRC